MRSHDRDLRLASTARNDKMRTCKLGQFGHVSSRSSLIAGQGEEERSGRKHDPMAGRRDRLDASWSRPTRSRPTRSRSASAISAAPASNRNCRWSSSPRRTTASPARGSRSRTTTRPASSSISISRWRRSGSRTATMSPRRRRRSPTATASSSPISPPDALLKAADALRDRGTVLFNAGAIDDRLREQDCRANVIHVAPTRSMLADALAQYLVWKQWKRWLLVVGSHDQRQAFRRRAAARRHALRRQDRAGANVSRTPAARGAPTAA